MKRKLLFVLFFSFITITVCFGQTVTLAELAFLANDCYTDYNQCEKVGYDFWVDDARHGRTGFYGAAYTKEDIVVIAFRGTDDSRDLSADRGIMLNSDSSLFSFLSSFSFIDLINPINRIFRAGDTRAAKAALDEQISDALAFYDEVYKKGKNVVIVGHSLGGYLAQIVGWEKHKQTYTFNAPGAFAYLNIDREDMVENSKKIHNYVATEGFDFIPRGTHIGERRDIRGYTHSMKQVYDTLKNSSVKVRF